MEGKLLFTVAEVAEVLSIGRSKVYEMVGQGVIPSVKIDGCRRIKAAALREYVAGLGEAA